MGIVELKALIDESRIELIKQQKYISSLEAEKLKMKGNFEG